MKKRTNPFQPIYNICNSGNSKQKLGVLPAFPRYLDIELTNCCNFRCLMCPVGTGSTKRKKGFMSDKIFFKILEQISPYRPGIRFIRWGEPLMHPHVIDYIRNLKANGMIVHINTNASLMDEKMAEALLDSGLDSIKFSFQGVDRKSYKEMRNRDFFNELLGKVRMLYRKRGKAERPFIHVSTTVTYETAGQISKFRDYVSDYVDLVSIGRTVLGHIDIQKTNLGKKEKDTLKYLKGKELAHTKHPECPEVFDMLSINWDGTVTACSGDFDNFMTVGDIKRDRIERIWFSKEMDRFRRLLSEMRHDEIPLCSQCKDYHDLQT